MATEFTHSIALIVPQSLWQQAGDLIALISNNKNDRMQFASPKYSPDYDACNISAKESHVQALLAAHAGQYIPARPEFDVNSELDIPALMQVLQSAQIITETTYTLVPGVIVIGIDMSVDAIAGMTNLIKVQGE